jgi:lysophospholipase L1-like esterase
MKRRIIAVLAAAALAVTFGAGVSPAAADEPDGVAYVALGDSVASGNGLLPYVDSDCLRSKNKSYPTLLAKASGLSFASEACTEAGTLDVAGQLQELVLAGAIGSDTELVTMTVGVNDVMWQPDPNGPVYGWGEALIACSNANVFPPGTCGPALYLSLLSLDPPDPAVPSLSERIAALIGAIRAAAPTARIVVTGYPILFGDVAGTCEVGLLDIPGVVRTQLTYGELERVWINQAVMAANGLIAQGVALAGDPNSAYVDVNVVPGGFDGHGLCDTGDKWISGLFPTTAQPRDRGFHPNAPGQRAYADIIAGALGW